MKSLTVISMSGKRMPYESLLHATRRIFGADSHVDKRWKWINHGLWEPTTLTSIRFILLDASFASGRKLQMGYHLLYPFPIVPTLGGTFPSLLLPFLVPTTTSASLTQVRERPSSCKYWRGG